MNAYTFGSLIGAIVLTGFISRILDKYAFKTQTPKKKAFIVGAITLIICVVLGSFNFGLTLAFFKYAPGVVIWLIFDLVRASR